MAMKDLITRSQVSAFRLARHHLAGGNPADLATLCQDVCGIQSQVTSAAHMSLWARAHNLTRAEINSALWESRTLVKTNCMRGTLHYLAAKDFAIYISALKTSRTRRALAFMATYGVTEKVARDAMEAAIEALRAGPRTRTNLNQHVLSQVKVGKKARVWFEKSWWGVVYLGIVDGLICYGAELEKNISLVRVDQWLPKQKRVSEQEAQQYLLRSYLRVYGPATLQDFSHWAGLSVLDAKAAGNWLNEELSEITVEGKKALILRDDYAQLRNSALEGRQLRLLPNFDAYLLAHAEKGHLVDPRFYKRVYRNQGWISPVVLLNGKVIGIWSIQRKGRRCSLEIEQFESFSKIIRAMIEAEAASLGRFMETSWEIKFHR